MPPITPCLVYANKENYRIIEQTLYQLDRPQLQVSIDATIAEITLNNSLKYGVQYFIQSKDIGLKPDSGSVDLVNAATSAVLSRALPGFNFLLGSEANPRIILDALRGVSDVKVLSAPSVVVLDNQVATLQVGDQIPVDDAIGNLGDCARRADRQQRRLPQHRRDPARGASDQRQRQCPA